MLLRLALCAAFLGGCSTAVECAEYAAAGVTVTVLDAAGARVCTAMVEAKSDGYTETLQVQPSDAAADCTYSGLWERAGTFTITATSARFDGPLTKTVTLTKDECHVIGQAFELRPSP